jgi:hypothetical protein
MKMKDFYKNYFFMEEKHNNLPEGIKPEGLKKETELDRETDYRGIAGSASLNASKKKIKLGDTADEDKDEDQDTQNPLIRGI